MASRTWAAAIIAKVCNEHRDSDLRADNPAVVKALNEARCKELNAAIMDAIHLGREAEREACALLAEDLRFAGFHNQQEAIGDAIRARGGE